MNEPLADELPIYRAAQREDLALFTGAHFQTLAPGTRYTPNWHVAAIAHQLQEVFEGRCRRLVINAPPRLLKSTLASVTFPAWGLGRDPTRRFVCVSHTQDLATEFANHCRNLMKSPSYRALFPHAIVSSRKDTETQFSMIAGGGRTSLSLNGPITGRGGDIIVIDDPIKAQDVFSELKRAEAQTWLRSTAVTRLNNPATGAIVLVMQRLHEDDPAGYVLEQGGWRHLNLPAKAQEDMIVPVGVGLTHVFRKGDLLDPRRLPQEELDQRMREMGESGFSAQYLQRPQPADGAIFRRAWLKFHAPDEALRRRGEIFQSWDIAVKTGDRHDYSVCTTWLRCGQEHFLLDVFRARVEYPELRRKVIELQASWGAQIVLIEDTVSGAPLIQELREMNWAVRAYGVKPSMEKEARAAAQSVKFELGHVYIAPDKEWTAALVDELLAFPRSRHDDQVDSVVQYLGFQIYDDAPGFGGYYLGGKD